jgi:hypothetical protein
MILKAILIISGLITGYNKELIISIGLSISFSIGLILGLGARGFFFN